MDFIACRKCAGKGIGGKTTGFIYDKETNISKECACHIQYREQNSLTERLRRSGVGNESLVLDYDIDRDYVGEKSKQTIAKIKFFLKKFKEKDPRYHHVMLYIYGANGTQKTTIAKYITREILATVKDEENKFQKSYYRATFISMNDLIKQLTQMNNNDDEANQTDLYKRILASDVLVVDECFDKEKVTIYKSGYQIPYLDSFLRKWMSDATKSIIFVSNVEPSEIEKNGYSHSIQDFVERQILIDKSTFSLEDNYIENMDGVVSDLFSGF